MKSSISFTSEKAISWRQGLLVVLLILLPVLVLYYKSFELSQATHSNDAPLGLYQSRSSHDASMPNGLASGFWVDGSWLGTTNPRVTPSFSWLTYWLWQSAVGTAKFYAPASLLVLGLSMWFCLTRLGLRPAVALLGALAAALNTNFVSYAGWGLPMRAMSAAAILIAIGLLTDQEIGQRGLWLRTILAGLAVGLNVVESGDTGAILSLVVAAYCVFQAWVRPGKPGRNILQSTLQSTLLAACAGWIAFAAIVSLKSTALQGVAAIQQKQQKPEELWDFLTGWSFPKAEIIRFAVPGVLGYTSKTPEVSAYWGGMGPDGDPHKRFSGSGEYLGLLVLLGASFALTRSCFNDKSPFSHSERKMIWFWAGLGGLSLLLAFGRFGPIYPFIYQLPLFNSSRIPSKWLHVVHLCGIILFAYGLEALARGVLSRTTSRLSAGTNSIFSWWRQAQGFDRYWSRGLLSVLCAAAVATVVYSNYKPSLSKYVQTFVPNAPLAAAMVEHSQTETWIALGVLVLCAGLWTAVQTGKFPVESMKIAWWLLGIVLTIDLLRAGAPFVVHYDYVRRYQTNPVIDLLKEEPWNNRLACRIHPVVQQMLTAPNDGVMPAVHNLWLENHFQYYNIQTLDIIQAPRLPELDDTYLKAFLPAGTDLHSIGRLWQLTSTRKVMAARGFESQLNSAVAIPGTHFVPKLGFELSLKPDAHQETGLQADDFTAIAKPDGAYAILDYDGALPRVSIVSAWKVETNNSRVLATLKDPTFDPRQTVMLASDPGLTTGGSTNAAPVSATITHYAPKQISIKAQSAVGGILLFNDRWHEDWKVTVDGATTPLLKANYIMRGVALKPGEHTVEFRFQPDARPLWISLSAWVVGLACLGLLLLTRPASPRL